MLNAAIVFLVIVFWKLSKSFSILQTTVSGLVKNQPTPPTPTFLALQHQKEELLRQTSQQGEKLLEELELISKNVRLSLEKQLHEVIRLEAENYRNFLKGLRVSAEKSFSDLKEDIQAIALDETHQFSKTSRDKILQMEKLLQNQLDEEQQKNRAFTAEYKKQMQQMVQDEGVNIISRAMSEVAPKVFTAQDHETIIIEALKQAQKDHVL